MLGTGVWGRMPGTGAGRSTGPPVTGRIGWSNWTRQLQPWMSLRRLDWAVTFYLIRRHRWTDLDAGVAQDTAFAATWFYYSRHNCNKEERESGIFCLFAVAVLSPVPSVRVKKQNRFK